MDNVNKTLYIPLYGKAFVSKKGILLQDKKAEEIWEKEGFDLKGKSKSKWLAYYMGMRSAVFDNWLIDQMNVDPVAVVLHIGCGMDSRVLRVGAKKHKWYDIDFPEVIEERKKYYTESDTYQMISGDARENKFLGEIKESSNAIVVMEGISMYLSTEEVQRLLQNINQHFGKVSLLMDCYTSFAAKASKYKNPINDVGVTKVYGIDDPEEVIAKTGFVFVKERDMTPECMMNELSGVENKIFKKIYGGKMSRKLYKLYEYRSVE